MSQRSDVLIVFGVTGDLARRQLFPALHELARSGRLGIPVVGVARSEWTVDELRRYARDSVREFAPHGVDERALDELTRSLSFVSGDYADPEMYRKLRKELEGKRRPVGYLAVPPSVFEQVIAGLADVGLNEGGRIIVEKPFGRDLKSSRYLNRCLLGAFDEGAVFRIDHFLGKESVLDLLVFRFDNLILEPLWNRHYISSVQITLAEDFGVEGRGGFYEEVGALRDVVQNHLLQLAALVAMEPPAAADARAVRDEKVKLLRSMPSFAPSEVVRGQYAGYREEEGVAAESQVETFVAVRAHIDNWRWAGVPFFMRAGKRLAVTATEVLVEFRYPPRPLFRDPDAPDPQQNHFVFRIKPDEGISLAVQIKQPGERLVSAPVELDYTYDEHREAVSDTAYERLLDGALEGDPTLFARSDAIDEAWRIVTPVLDEPGPLAEYEPGTWGPPEAERLVEGGWHVPVAR